MKKKIRCIYIDGIEKSGKTSVSREIRKFLKNKNKDLHEIKGTSIEKLNQQEAILSENHDSFILKENSLLYLFHKEIKENGIGASFLEEKYEEMVRLERTLNHSNGCVHFFLIPEDQISLTRIYGDIKDRPSYVDDVIGFYKGINSYSISQGLDIELIPFNEFDRIYDIRDKILKIIEKKYQI